MRPNIYEIERIGSGWLAVMETTSGDWAADEFAGLSELGDHRRGVIASAAAEARGTGLAGEAGYCEAAGIRFRSCCLSRTGGVPSSAEDALQVGVSALSLVRGRREQRQSIVAPALAAQDWSAGLFCFIAGWAWTALGTISAARASPGTGYGCASAVTAANQAILSNTVFNNQRVVES